MVHKLVYSIDQGEYRNTVPVLLITWILFFTKIEYIPPGPAQLLLQRTLILGEKPSSKYRPTSGAVPGS